MPAKPKPTRPPKTHKLGWDFKAMRKAYAFVSPYRREAVITARKIKDPEKRAARLRELSNPTLVTRIVSDFAKKFQPTEKSIGRLVENIRDWLVEEKDRRVAETAYDWMTAEDVIHFRKIPVVYAKQRGTRVKEPVWGCKTQCDALVAVLDAMGVENRFVRTMTELGNPHSVVWFKLGNREYLANPFPTAVLSFMDKPVEQVGQSVRARIQAMKEAGHWNVGKNSQEMEITFKKFWKESK